MKSEVHSSPSVKRNSQHPPSSELGSHPRSGERAGGLRTVLLLFKPFHVEFQRGLMWLDTSGHIHVADGETEASEEAGLCSEFMAVPERTHRPSACRPHGVVTSPQTVVSSVIIGHTLRLLAGMPW